MAASPAPAFRCPSRRFSNLNNLLPLPHQFCRRFLRHEPRCVSLHLIAPQLRLSSRRDCIDSPFHERPPRRRQSTTTMPRTPGTSPTSEQSAPRSKCVASSRHLLIGYPVRLPASRFRPFIAYLVKHLVPGQALLRLVGMQATNPIAIALPIKDAKHQCGVIRLNPQSSSTFVDPPFEVIQGHCLILAMCYNTNCLILACHRPAMPMTGLNFARLQLPRYWY